jgi:hypothetical protein
LGFGFYFSKNRVFGWVLGFSKIKKKLKNFTEIFRQNCDEKRKKIKKNQFNSSNLLQSIGLQWWEKPWFHQKPTEVYG